MAGEGPLDHSAVVVVRMHGCKCVQRWGVMINFGVGDYLGCSMPPFFGDQKTYFLMKCTVARYSDINLVACFGDQCGSVHQAGRTVPPEDNILALADLIF